VRFGEAIEPRSLIASTAERARDQEIASAIRLRKPFECPWEVACRLEAQFGKEICIVFDPSSIRPDEAMQASTAAGS
jgi:hypothetical protein